MTAGSAIGWAATVAGVAFLVVSGHPAWAFVVLVSGFGFASVSAGSATTVTVEAAS